MESQQPKPKQNQVPVLTEIKQRHEWFKNEFNKNKSESLTIMDWVEARGQVEKLLEIVDDQDQRIRDLQNGKTLGSLHHQIVTLEVKILDQVREIERLKKEHADFIAGIGFEP